MNIERNQAKKLIASEQVKFLTQEEKRYILEGDYWWFEGEETIRDEIKEGTYPKISDDLIQIIHTNPKPVFLDHSEINILIIDFLIFKLTYATNQYLKTKLLHFFNKEYNIQGKPQKAGLCPCCEYYSIDFGEDGFCDICPVCFWENGGSGPNHMTLKEAQNNFKKIGAMNERSLEFIEPDGRIKYKKHQPSTD